MDRKLLRPKPWLRQNSAPAWPLRRYSSIKQSLNARSVGVGSFHGWLVSAHAPKTDWSKSKTDSLRSAPEATAYPMVDKQQDNGPYQGCDKANRPQAVGIAG